MTKISAKRGRHSSVDSSALSIISSCSPGLNPKHDIYAISIKFQIESKIFHCIEKRKKKQKEAEVGPLKKDFAKRQIWSHGLSVGLYYLQTIYFRNLQL